MPDNRFLKGIGHEQTAYYYITIAGPDRIGFVEQVTRQLLAHDANVDKSRMVRLGGDFAMLMLVSVPTDALPAIQETIDSLLDGGYQVSTRMTSKSDPSRYSGWMPFRIRISGADHEGIIHHVTKYLAALGVNIETMSTGSDHAPMSGTPLFTMDALVVAPPVLTLSKLRVELATVSDTMNVDTDVTPYAG